MHHKIQYLCFIVILFLHLVYPEFTYASELVDNCSDENVIELLEEAESVSDDKDTFQVTVEKNSEGIWIVRMESNSTIKLLCTNQEMNKLQALSSEGNIVGKVDEKDVIEISAFDAGTGAVAFQRVDSTGNFVGEPIKIAVIIENSFDEDQIVADYYKDAVFCGDSIMVGLRNYASKNVNSFLHDAQYLAVGSYSLRYALNPNNPENLHPVYKGRKRVIWESIEIMKPKRVFLFFGLNDLNVIGLEKTRDCYLEIVRKIKEKSPEVEINVISMTMTLEGTGKHNLSNDKIREFNQLLKKTAMENDWGYVDLASSIIDENGNLAPQYCSDGFIHHSRSAYDQVWTRVLKDYAIREAVEKYEEK